MAGETLELVVGDVDGGEGGVDVEAAFEVVEVVEAEVEGEDGGVEVVRDVGDVGVVTGGVEVHVVTGALAGTDTSSRDTEDWDEVK